MKKQLRPAPDPIETDPVKLTVGLTIAWAVAFVVLLVLHGRLAGAGHGWWTWTPAAGMGVGAFGYWYTTRRRDAIARDAARRAAEAESEEPEEGARRP